MKKIDLNGAFPPADEGFDRGMNRAFEAIGKEKVMNQLVDLPAAAALEIAAEIALGQPAGGLGQACQRFAHPVGDEGGQQQGQQYQHRADDDQLHPEGGHGGGHRRDGGIEQQPCWPQLEKALMQPQRPNAAKHYNK